MGLTDISAPAIRSGQVSGRIDFSQKIPFYYLDLGLRGPLPLSSSTGSSTPPSGGPSSRSGRTRTSPRRWGSTATSTLSIVVVISAAIAGAAGSLYAHYVSFIDPGVFNFYQSVNMVMMVIGGGQGTLAGPIIGAILFTLIPEWLRVFGDARMAIYAVVVILIVIFMPQGILFYFHPVPRI